MVRVGPGGTATVEKLVAAVVDSGGCSRWCSVEAGDRLPVLGMYNLWCGFVAGAGRRCGVLQELSHQG